jgi:hypothetical protein
MEDKRHTNFVLELSLNCAYMFVGSWAVEETVVDNARLRDGYCP